MKLYAPAYYNNFNCIAEKCRHNCCIGWEIDIDSETFAFYKSIGGDFSERFKNSVAETETGASFILGENERCPFLNENGLCDIITEFGETALCQICGDHPRFRNYFSDRTEIGLGLCCEEAARIILTNKEKPCLVLLDDDGLCDEADEEEKAFFTFREKLFTILTDREKSVEKRLEAMLSFCGVTVSDLSNAKLYEMFLSLERLDEAWDEKLGLLKQTEKAFLPKDDETELAFEQLAVYFIYRHLASFFDCGDTLSGVIFTALSMQLIMRLCSAQLEINGCLTADDIAEIARMYSSEIEYSDENIEALLETADSLNQEGSI